MVEPRRALSTLPLANSRQVIIERGYMFEHSEWFKPYAAGYYAFTHNLPHDKEFVMQHLDQLLDFGRPLPLFPPFPIQIMEA
jgi:hypothetical protein